MAIKLSCFTLVIFLVGCQSAGFNSNPSPGSDPLSALLRAASAQSKINKLPPAERCDYILIELRKACREKVKKELEELTKAMKKDR